MSWLKKAGKKVGHGISKNWKKLTGRYHSKHHKKCNSIFQGGCCGAKKANSCGGARGIDRGYGCNKPMNQMNNNMMMGMFNNIINRLISILQQSISNRGLSQPQILNTYNTYNTYPTVNRNIFNTTNQNISNITYDNDIINTNVNGIGNSVIADA